MPPKPDARAFFEAAKRKRKEHPWRWWWQKRLTALRWAMAQCVSTVWKYTLGRWLWVKIYESSGSVAAMLEVENLRYVREHTSIPVPIPLFWSHWPPFSKNTQRRPYVLMTKVPGVNLESVLTSLHDETKARVVGQLASYVAQLRALQSPHGLSICSVVGGPVHCIRLRPGKPVGPFKSETEMNAYLRHQFSLDELDSSISEMHARTHLPITFTHGDLLPRNIMYHDGAITAIIDWENAGWYPAHWEYIKARFGLTHYEKLWAPWIPKYLEEYAEEWLADARLSSVAWWITGCD